MNQWSKAILLSVAICCSVSALDRAGFLELNRRAAARAREKDWKGLREALLDIRKQMPGNLAPRWLLRMASVETHLGNRAEALRLLRKFGEMGLSYDVSRDPDLAPLAAEEELKQIEELYARNRASQSNATIACVIPLADLMPEDITYDSQHRWFVVTSIRRHGLYRLQLPRIAGQACTLAELPLPAQAKAWPAMAVRYDRKRDVLWMTVSAMPDFVGVPKDDQGKTQLLAWDNKTGSLLHEISANESGPAVLGDMSLAPDGTLYVTASLGGGVYRLGNGAAKPTLEKISQGFSPQTPVLASDGKRLFVPDYPMGIAVVNLSAPSTTELSYLPHPDNVAVTGIDGLYKVGGSLIGIQNGTNPQRIIRLRLNHDETAIVSAEIVEQSELSGDLNHAVLVGDVLYSLSNVGWDKLDDNGNLKPGEHLVNPLLLRQRLPGTQGVR